jgi:putative thioredoxin
MSQPDVTNFEDEVIERSRKVPVLCDFWAPWCGPCRMFGPLLEKAALEAGARWELAKVNVEDHREVSDRFRITGIPAVKLFVDGEVVAEFTGAMGARELNDWLEKHLPGGIGSQFEKVEKALAELDFKKAAEFLESPELPAGSRRDFLFAKATLWHDPRRAMALLGESPADDVGLAEWQAVEYLAGLLAGERPATGDSGHDRAFATVHGHLRRGNLADAMEVLTKILIEKPTFREGEAVRLQRALIHFLGIRHPLSERHYAVYSGAASLL